MTSTRRLKVALEVIRRKLGKLFTPLTARRAWQTLASLPRLFLRLKTLAAQARARASPCA